MKVEIFISYSDFNKDKVDIILDELKNHELFYPIVIASNREALKPLVKKVTDGIIRSTLVIPIISKKSITTQWINQEIGFATALEKKIIPIVEMDTLDSLKGFIHKQIDLPYCYNANDDINIENANFIHQFRILLSDLHNEYEMLIESNKESLKSEFELNSDLFEKMSFELEKKKLRKEFLKSPQALELALQEVNKLLNEFEEKFKQLDQKHLQYSLDKEIQEPSLIFTCNGFGITIEWKTQFSETVDNMALLVKYWEGIVTRNSIKISYSGERPRIIVPNKFTFDKNNDGSACWLRHEDNIFYETSQIVDNCISWLTTNIYEALLNQRD